MSARRRRRRRSRCLGCGSGITSIGRRPATRAFFEVGYERTTIRAVAGAADVDAGLVMHYFGSKQALFQRVVENAPLPELDAAPGQAAEHILSGLADRLADTPVASLTILRSMLTTPEAATADPEQVIRLLRPGIRGLTAGIEDGDD